MTNPTAEQAISREDAKHVVHAAIFGLCMKDKNTCAGDYSYHSLQALDALPDLAEQARKEERDAIVAWLRGEIETQYTDPQFDIGANLADAIERGDHREQQ